MPQNEVQQTWLSSRFPLPATGCIYLAYIYEPSVFVARVVITISIPTNWMDRRREEDNGEVYRSRERHRLTIEQEDFWGLGKDGDDARRVLRWNTKRITHSFIP